MGNYTYRPTNSGPHQVRNIGGNVYSYDANGNMTTVGGQITTWDAENRPTSIARVSGSETYAYDADGERIGRTAGFTTTVFLGGMWQEDVAGGAVGLTRVLYGFNGATVAQRTHVTRPASASVVYLHGDHLGSVSVVSGWNGTQATLLSSQRFDPWGKVLPGGNVTQTRTNYTGQELDTTQLLYYHARYYDPNLARFVSADSLVPDPANPQDLNRYSYVHNNPVRYNDPTGHIVPCKTEDCRSRLDISNWPDLAKGLAVAGCFVLGCEVDLDEDVIIGPSPETAVLDLMPGGAVVKGPGTALRLGSRVIKGIDTIVNGQRVRQILNILTKKQKTYLRKEAKLIYDRANPGRRVAEDLEIHHRIPLEYAHLLPNSDPNRLSNLTGLSVKIHDQVEARWRQFSTNLGGQIPSAAEVLEFAGKIDEEFSRFYR